MSDSVCEQPTMMGASWTDTASHVSVGLGIAAVVLLPLLSWLLRRGGGGGGGGGDGSSSTSPRRRRHVVITGGSSGIGLSLARECLTRRNKNDGTAFFSHVTLVARNRAKLEAARAELASATHPDTQLHTVSADVSDHDGMTSAVRELVHTTKTPPTLLFNVAGVAMPCRFRTADPGLFQQLMDVNYLGTVYATRAVVPYMETNGGGTVVFCSSMAGQVGIYGFSAYSPSKFALRGLAEVLTMELGPFNIHVQLAFPPNTETPGFGVENEHKMEECRLMEDEAGLYQPEAIAKKMLREALRPNPPFTVYFGLEGWMLGTLTSGMSAVHTWFDAVCQLTLMSLLRLVSLFYLRDFRNITDRCHAKRLQEEAAVGSSSKKEAADPNYGTMTK